MGSYERQTTKTEKVLQYVYTVETEYLHVNPEWRTDTLSVATKSNDSLRGPCRRDPEQISK